MKEEIFRKNSQNTVLVDHRRASGMPGKVYSPDDNHHRVPAQGSFWPACEADQEPLLQIT